jgi:hypothetical protein
VELKRQYLRLLVMLLPPVSRLLLYRLLELLNKIAASSEDRVDPETGQPVGTGNLMTASNLGVVIGPNILRDMSPASLDDSNSKNKTGSGTTVNTSSPDLLAQDNTAAINAVKCLIEEYQLLFIIPEEVIEKLKLHAAIPLKYTLALKK